MFYKIWAFFLLFTASTAFAQTPTPATSRTDGVTVHYYASLHEAFDSATGTSIDTPDEITVLSDIILDEPIIIDTAKHIRLVTADGNRTIQRGSGNLEYPLFWLIGDSATLTLGKPNMKNNLIIDGGYLNTPSIEARAPLITINGRNSKLIMYDKVFLQNNYSNAHCASSDTYRNGAGIFIRTVADDLENQAEFIMKGGTIQGNINNQQNPTPCGGGVFIAGFGFFIMEGGVIMNNTAYRSGGGFHTGGRGTFKKTGGIIYGSDAPVGYRNTVIDGTSHPIIYGHALCAAYTLKYEELYAFRDDTVGENESLTFIGDPVLANLDLFGKGDKWSRSNEIQNKINRFWWIIAIASVLALGGILFLFIVKRKRQAIPAGAIKPAVKLSPREREIFNLLLTDLSTKQIADKLGLSYSGVNFHIQNLYRKLKLQSRTELLTKFVTKPDTE
jgi:DNA-binding CsgD family transcriptional regulator